MKHFIADIQRRIFATDPGETKNLSAAEPERVQQLAAAWDRWNAENVEPA